MKHNVFWRLLCGCLLQCLLWSAATATTVPMPADWRDWFVRQVDVHPDIVTAQETRNAALAAADQFDRPLYNPELLGGYEREGDDRNWRVGVGQTLDVSRRRDAQQDMAVAVRELAAQNFALVWQQQAGRTLAAMVVRQAAQERYVLALEQQQQLDSMIELMRQRQMAGDLGQIDVEMTLLSLSRRLNDTAVALAEFERAEADLRELLMNWDAERSEVPVEFWSLSVAELSDAELQAHPAVQSAWAAWQVLEHEATVADRSRKSAPSLTLEGGQEGDERLIGVGFSMPLRVRNSFDDEVRSAQQRALAARSDYNAALRRQRFNVDAAYSVALQFREQFTRWNTVGAASGELSGNLLLRQWQEGDLGTNEYLLLLQQRIDGLLAAIELAERYRLSLIDWLTTSGRISAAIPAREE